jgi:hypothetical protein
MLRGLALVGVIGIATTGCLWERNGDRPARMQLGMNSRHLAVVVPEKPVGGYLERTTTDPNPPPSSKDVASSAITGSVQFTMQAFRGFYLGGEVEAGRLADHEGSNFGALYGVAGAETTSRWGSLSVEMIAGRRWLRYELGDEDVGSFALEPRIRGQMWLSPQVTLGGLVGANAAPGANGWMAGVYFGVYSNLFGTGK